MKSCDFNFIQSLGNKDHTVIFHCNVLAMTWHDLVTIVVRINPSFTYLIWCGRLICNEQCLQFAGNYTTSYRVNLLCPYLFLWRILTVNCTVSGRLWTLQGAGRHLRTTGVRLERVFLQLKRTSKTSRNTDYIKNMNLPNSAPWVDLGRFHECRRVILALFMQTGHVILYCFKHNPWYYVVELHQWGDLGIDIDYPSSSSFDFKYSPILQKPRITPTLHAYARV